MIFRKLGFVLCSLTLLGCVAPMGQREAQILANRRLTQFCRTTVCGTPHLLKAQKIKDRWLVDYEATGGLFTVAVDSGGNTDVSVWDKNSPR